MADQAAASVARLIAKPSRCLVVWRALVALVSPGDRPVWAHRGPDPSPSAPDGADRLPLPCCGVAAQGDRACSAPLPRHRAVFRPRYCRSSCAAARQRWARLPQPPGRKGDTGDRNTAPSVLTLIGLAALAQYWSGGSVLDRSGSRVCGVDASSRFSLRRGGPDGRPVSRRWLDPGGESFCTAAFASRALGLRRISSVTAALFRRSVPLGARGSLSEADV